MLYGYLKRGWKTPHSLKPNERDDIATEGITSERQMQWKANKFTISHPRFFVSESRTWHGVKKDKKSMRKAIEMVNMELEKLVCEMP